MQGRCFGKMSLPGTPKCNPWNANAKGCKKRNIFWCSSRLRLLRVPRDPPNSIPGATFPTNVPIWRTPSSTGEPGPSWQRLGTREQVRTGLLWVHPGTFRRLRGPLGLCGKSSSLQVAAGFGGFSPPELFPERDGNDAPTRNHSYNP